MSSSCSTFSGANLLGLFLLHRQLGVGEESGSGGGDRSLRARSSRTHVTAGPSPVPAHTRCGRVDHACCGARSGAGAALRRHGDHGGVGRREGPGPVVVEGGRWVATRPFFRVMRPAASSSARMWPRASFRTWRWDEEAVPRCSKRLQSVELRASALVSVYLQ